MGCWAKVDPIGKWATANLNPDAHITLKDFPRATAEVERHISFRTRRPWVLGRPNAEGNKQRAAAIITARSGYDGRGERVLVGTARVSDVCGLWPVPVTGGGKWLLSTQVNYLPVPLTTRIWLTGACMNIQYINSTSVKIDSSRALGVFISLSAPCTFL